MEKISYKLLEKRQALQIKVYGVICVLLFVIVVVYGVVQYLDYSKIKTAIAENTETLTLIKEQTAYEKEIYSQNKDDFDNLSEDIENKLTEIFPTDDHYKELTRQMDSFEEELNTKANPFKIINLSYESADTMEIEGTYGVLPFSMVLETTYANFTKFFHMIESSGSLDNPIR
ncbi:hypothetical protein KJ632_02825, partial [Patescibacteria group bacterium]|nr:hypothetical protein [Patescibacteria group bacterium]